VNASEITVDQFAQWWLQNRPLAPPANAIIRVGIISGICLFRAGPFQVELFIGEPNATAPRHHHPNVDSVEVLLSGEVDFNTDRNELVGGRLRILPGERHVALAGPSGVAFFSIQKWLNGVQPSTVTADWEGEPIDEGHREKLCLTNGGG
jgi:hypothetical protein